MKYPTLEEVEKADHIQICRWYRFLPSPMREKEWKVLEYISERFLELGGMTPAISKMIGWDPPA